MNKLKLIFLFTLFYNISIAQFNFCLKGNCEKLLEDEKIYLKIEDNYSPNSYVYVDSTIIKKGEFNFNGTIKKPSELVCIYLKNKRSIKFLVIDSGFSQIIIKRINKNSPTKKNLLSNIEIPNSISYELYKERDSLYYLNYLESKNKKINSQRATQKKFYLDQVNLIEKYPSTFYSLIYLCELTKYSKTVGSANLLRVFNILDYEIQKSKLGSFVKLKINNIDSSKIGQIIPYFRLFDKNNKVFTKDSLSKKVYLIAFCATWCGPCNNKIPYLKSLYNKFKKSQFEVIYINLGNEKDKWLIKTKEVNMNWLDLTDNSTPLNSEIGISFNINYIPLYILVNQERKIIYNSLQLEDSENKLLEYYISSAL